MKYFIERVDAAQKRFCAASCNSKTTQRLVREDAPISTVIIRRECGNTCDATGYGGGFPPMGIAGIAWFLEFHHVKQFDDPFFPDVDVRNSVCTHDWNFIGA
jgi:hypothetical protein